MKEKQQAGAFCNTPYRDHASTTIGIGDYSCDSHLPVIPWRRGPRLAVAPETGLRGKAVGAAEPPESNAVMHVFYTTFHASAGCSWAHFGRVDLAMVQTS